MRGQSVLVKFQILPSGVDVRQVFVDDDDMPFPYWLYETVDYGGRLVDKSKSHSRLSGGGEGQSVLVSFQILPLGVDVSQLFTDDNDMPFPYWLYETVDYGGRLVDKSKSYLQECPAV